MPNSGLLYFGVVHLMTFIREPIQRYISEYEHVKRGATWPKAVRTCKNLDLYKESCLKKGIRIDISMQEFLKCDVNLGNNRQVRMLADYNVIGCTALKCWTKSANCSQKMKEFNEQKVLHSAKHTLLGLAFFGLTEYQTLSEFLFVKTFGDNKFKLSEPIIEKKDTQASISMKGEAGKYIDRIKSNNHLDIQLYEFAKEIFFKRVAYFKNEK